MITAPKTKDRSPLRNSDIGSIPIDWEVGCVAELATITTGNKNTQDRVDGGTYPFFVRSDSVERINTWSYDGEAVLTAGDGVGTGKIFHYINDKFDFHQRVYKMSDFSPRISGYFFYLYFSAHFFERIMQMTAKSSVDSVRREMIADMQIPIPPKPEQEAIVNTLRDTDSLIIVLEKLTAKKRAIKQGAMQELLTGKRRLPGFTGKWSTAAFGDLFTFSGGYPASREQLSNQGLCYLHYGDIHLSLKTIMDVREEYASIPKLNVPLKSVPKRFLLEDGDIVFVDASEDTEGTSRHIVVVNTAGIPFISGLHTILAKARSNDLIHEYRRYCFQTRAVKDQFCYYAVGTKVSGVSRTNIAKIIFQYPPKPEQLAIAQVLTNLEDEIHALESKLAKLRRLKQGMMQALLIGKVRLKSRSL